MGIFPISLSFLWKCHRRVSPIGQRGICLEEITCVVGPEFTEYLSSFSWNSNGLGHSQTPLHHANTKYRDKKHKN